MTIIKKRLIPGILFAIFLSAACTACNDDNNAAHDETWPFPANESAGAPAYGLPPSEGYIKDDVERWQSYQASVLYGEVVRVAPVVDNWRSDLGDEGFVYTKTCNGTGYVRPALRITLRVEKASWPVDEHEELIVGLDDFILSGWEFRAVPLVHTDDMVLGWSDGNEYFAKGSHVGFVGQFDKNRVFRTYYPMFTLDADGVIRVPSNWPQGRWTNKPFEYLANALKRTKKDAYAAIYRIPVELSSICPFNGPEEEIDYEPSAPEVNCTEYPEICDGW